MLSSLDLFVNSQIVKSKQVDHTINEKKVLASINFPFLVNLEYSFKVSYFMLNTLSRRSLN